jgi:hypothetical protein
VGGTERRHLEVTLLLHALTHLPLGTDVLGEALLVAGSGVPCDQAPWWLEDPSGALSWGRGLGPPSCDGSGTTVVKAWAHLQGASSFRLV